MKTKIKILNEISKQYKQQDFEYAVKNVLPSVLIGMVQEAMQEYNEQYVQHNFEFTEWIGLHYIRYHNHWVHRYADCLNKNNWQTTQRLWNYFIKIKTTQLTK